jgi:O-antigen/teichoic acid export membrane protein
LQLIRKSLGAVGGLSLVVSALVFFLARPICRIVLGHSFAPSAYLLEWLSPLPLLCGLMSVLGTQTMLTFEMDSLMSWIVLASAGVSVPLTLTLSWLFGAAGAAIASVTVAALTVSAMIIALRVHGLSVWRKAVGAVAASRVETV